MSQSIASDLMAAANPNFRVHSVEEVIAAANNAVAMGAEMRQIVGGQREQFAVAQPDSVSLASSVASMDAADKPVQAVVPEVDREITSASFESEAQGPDIDM